MISMAALTAIDPNSVAFFFDNFPKKEPIGVLLAATIYEGAPKMFLTVVKAYLICLDIILFKINL